MQLKKLPQRSVRGQVRAWVEKHAAGLGADVLEVGSRMHQPDAWWVVNRDLAQGQWLGIDMQDGPNVDQVVDLHELPEGWTDRFTGVLLSEVLEHVRNPWLALTQIHRVMQPGALLIVTVPFCFPRHSFPSDYWRFTEEGIRAVLSDSGFVDIETANSGPNVAFAVNDHGEPGLIRRNEPLHTFALARKQSTGLLEVTAHGDARQSFVPGPAAVPSGSRSRERRLSADAVSQVDGE